MAELGTIEIFAAVVVFVILFVLLQSEVERSQFAPTEYVPGMLCPLFTEPQPRCNDKWCDMVCSPPPGAVNIEVTSPWDKQHKN